MTDLMRYHDNIVSFDSQVAAFPTFSGSSFTVKIYKVTSGQDPDDLNYVGEEKAFTDASTLNFRVGRKGDEDVASWWSARIPANQNTYASTPDELNFAFIGTLLLISSSGELWYLYDIGLAQGSSGSRNDWWFGGDLPESRYVEKNTVKCPATSSLGKTAFFYFLRGDNAINEVILTKVE